VAVITLSTCIFMVMKKHITLIIILMALCVSGIIALQLYWNYQNYRGAVKTFEHDSNEALRAAVDRETGQRHQAIIIQFANWLRDTSFITITCNAANRDHQTVFSVSDTHRYPHGDKGFSLSIDGFRLRLAHITPQAKSFFISHFSNNVVRSDLEKQSIFYYTQRLGDSLKQAFYGSRLNKAALSTLYANELNKRGIAVAFVLVAMPGKSLPYYTQPVNTALNRPYQMQMITAGFNNPYTFVFRQMKWLLVVTMLLIAITLFCFTCTTKTLLSQHKLAALKNDFINNMTHELNTPLASIKITAEALKTFNHNPAVQQEYLDMITFQTDKLTGLTARILNHNRAINHTEDNNTVVDLDTLIQSALKLLLPQLTNKQAMIHYNPPAVSLTVKGQAPALLSAFVNIIDNALKYNEQACTRLTIALQQQRDYISIAFADNGIGIPAAYHQKVFEQFFRVPQGNTHNVQGHGLGLSYVRQVISLHKGSINVSANQPNGSVFTIKLPLWL
jgi:two-component system phosphate regulon sensor histidine kinase PhoR